VHVCTPLGADCESTRRTVATNMPPMSSVPDAPPARLTTAPHAGVHIEGAGTPVVLLHSSLSSNKQWRALIERLRGSYRLIAIDLYGYGETPPPASGCFTLGDEVQLVRSVLESTLRTGERFHLVGHSYGGVVALQLAQGLPARLRSLTLYEPIPFHLLPAAEPVMDELLAIQRQVEASLAGHDAGAGVASFVDYWSGAGAFARMPGERRATLCRLLPKIALELRAVAAERTAAADYERVFAPVCLMGGRHSPRAAHVSLAALAKIFPHALYRLVNAGHLAPATHPELVNPFIERFIRATDDRLPTWNLDSCFK
jgi:pimeloyl-ACP methyl ester carboxylesterase